MTLDASLRQLREATVIEHMEAENAHDFDRCIAAFAHPRYEIVATGEVWDGHTGVNTLLRENKTGFSDFQFHPERMHHSDEAVIVEGDTRRLDPEHGDAYNAAYKAKYAFDISEMPDPRFVVQPHVVFGFIDSANRFGATATRWTF